MLACRSIFRSGKKDPAIRMEILYARWKRSALLKIRSTALRDSKHFSRPRETKLFDPIAISARHFGRSQGREARSIYRALSSGEQIHRYRPSNRKRERDRSPRLGELRSARRIVSVKRAPSREIRQPLHATYRTANKRCRIQSNCITHAYVSKFRRSRRNMEYITII